MAGEERAMQSWQNVPGSDHVDQSAWRTPAFDGEGLAPRSHQPLGARLRQLLPLLGCTECHGPLLDERTALQCPRCGHRYRKHDGLMDFAPFVEQAGMAQRLVEGLTLSPIYEGLFRPLLKAATQLHPSELIAADHWPRQWIGRWFSDVEGPVLDLGCGGGRYSRLLATELDEADVIGVDLDAAALQEAQRLADEQGLPIAHLRADALALPLQASCLAGVGCFMTLELLADPARALHEVARVLRPGGRFVGITVKPSGSPLLMKLEEHLSHTAGVHLFGERELERHLEHAGLEPLELARQGMVLLFAAQRVGPPEAEAEARQAS